MSQAHNRCGSHRSMPQDECAGAICRWTCQNGNQITLCKVSLDYWCEFADDDEDLEPTKIEWIWDAGTRMCWVHNWPAVLCEGWYDEHQALIEKLAAPYLAHERAQLTTST